MSAQQKQGRLAIGVFLCIAASFGYLLWVSWLRWGDLLVDTGVNLWIPWQLLQGKVLYTDVYYSNGFFPPYFQALLYQIFGIHLNTAVGCGIGITILMMGLLYKIARLFLDQLVAGLIVLNFLFVCAFGNYCYIFNFILPSNTAAVFYVLFSASALYCFLLGLLREKPQYLLGWSCSVTLAFCSRPELAFPVWLGFIFIGGVALLKDLPRQRWQWGGYLLSPVLFSVAGYSLFFIKTQSFEGFKAYFLGALTGVSKFNAALMGMQNLAHSFWLMGQAVIWHGVIIGLLGLASVMLFPFFFQARKSPLFLLTGVAALLAAVSLALKTINPRLQYRIVPVVLLIGIAFTLLKMIRSKNSTQHLAVLTVFVIALAAMARGVFNADPFFYGFYLLDLGLLGYYLFFFRLVKEGLQSYFKRFPWPFFAVLLMGFFIGSISISHAISLYWCHHKDVKVVTDRGTLYCANDARTKRFWEAVAYFKEQTSPRETMVVLPLGIELNFFADRNSPFGYPSFDPSLWGIVSEQQVIARFAQTPADYVVILQSDTAEYGYASFGKDYAQGLSAWILNHYRLVKQFGPYPFTSDEFGIAILKRNET